MEIHLCCDGFVHLVYHISEFLLCFVSLELKGRSKQTVFDGERFGDEVDALDLE